MPTPDNSYIPVDDAECSAMAEHKVMARHKPADPADVVAVLTAITDDDGRSEPVWLRLWDGTLILGVFPRGDTYMQMSDKGVCDFWD